MNNNLSKYIDHTNLKPEATQADIEKLCREAIENSFATVCVNASRVQLAKTLLQNSGVGIATVVGFPLGATTTTCKTNEAIEAVKNGATEIDMVINIGKIKDKEFDYVENDIKEVVRGCGVAVKAILETCKLTKEEIIIATKIAVKSGVAFVKTSTGFGGGGATVEDVKLMKDNCGNALVKASGGIRDYQTAKNMIAVGANRLGTSSGIEILAEEKE